MFDLANAIAAGAGAGADDDDDKYSTCLAAVPNSDQLFSCSRWNWVWCYF